MIDPIRSLIVGVPERDRGHLSSTLKQAGLSVDFSSAPDSGAVGELFRRERWDAVLLDQDVWTVDGARIAGLAREHETQPPVIAIVRQASGDFLSSVDGDLSDWVSWEDLSRLAWTIPRRVRESRERVRQRQLETRLRLSERRYRSLIENMHEGVWMVDSEGLTTGVNRSMAEMLGYAPDEMIGRPIYDFIVPPRTEAVGQQFEEELRSSPVTREVLLQGKSGARVEALMRTVPVFDEHGQLEYGFATVQDVTERRQLQRQIRQGQKMELIGQFTGGLTHDFNNMLTVIAGNAQLLGNHEDLSETGAELLDEIITAAQTTGNLTKSLLAFSRKQDMRIETVDLNEVVAGIVPMLRRMIRETIEVQVVPGEDLWPTDIDRAQIGQVLMNLAVNARDAMPGGGVLMIETENVELDDRYAARHADVKPGNYVRLSVSDSGVGMDEETQDRIFEPFFTTKGEGEGTGLGLATVYGIVRQIGGWIYVYSEPDEGTIFKIYFPAAQSPEVHQIDAGADSPDLSGDETILLVEDDDAVRDFARMALERRGYSVVEAANGCEASEVLRGDVQIDLVITDVIMPETNGKAIAAEAEEVRPETPVLYISGYNGDAVRRKGLAGESMRLLQKPFGPDDLTARVREILDEQE